MQNQNQNLATEQANQSALPLQQIAAIARLCGFAAEARRVLTEVDLACRVDPALDAQLARLVEARLEWASHTDTLPQVLQCLADKIEVVHTLLTEPKGHHVGRKP